MENWDKIIFNDNYPIATLQSLAFGECYDINQNTSKCQSGNRWQRCKWNFVQGISIFSFCKYSTVAVYSIKVSNFILHKQTFQARYVS